MFDILRQRLGAPVFAALLLLVPASLRAHEIPRRVAVQAFLKPEGRVLRALVRVPLEAMRDVEFPLRGPGYLDLARSDTLLRDAARLWVADGLVAYADGARLAAPRVVVARASMPADGAFADYATAMAHTRGDPIAPTTDIPWQQAMLDVLLEYDIVSDSAVFSIEPAFAKLGVRTSTVVRFLPPGGAERAFVFDGDPGVVSLDPGFFDAAWRFVRLGFTHILDGTDHLLFLCCLVLPFRSFRPLVGLVTAFTVAHSITLFASALGFAPSGLWFPPLVETLIALSIVLMACENMLGAKLQRRWIVAFAFGLVHGFGFSFALRESLQFAGSHLVTSLAAFNVGVELGQLAVLAVALPVLVWLFRRVPERGAIILISAFVAHTAWHWTTERGAALREFEWSWSALGAFSAADALGAAALLLLVAGAAWLLYGVIGRWMAQPTRATVAASIVLVMVAFVSPATAMAQVKAPVKTGIKVPAKSPAQPPAKAGAAVTKPAPAAQNGARTTMSGVYTAEQARQGREVFTGTCTGCHTPAAHTGLVFTSKWVGQSVDDLFTYVRNSMPKIAPGSLTEDEYVWVTAYLLKLNGMPAGTSELSAEPAAMRALRIDTLPRVRKRS